MHDKLAALQKEALSLRVRERIITSTMHEVIALVSADPSELDLDAFKVKARELVENWKRGHSLSQENEQMQE